MNMNKKSNYLPTQDINRVSIRRNKEKFKDRRTPISRIDLSATID